jgi:predicted metal-binding membrane protein
MLGLFGVAAVAWFYLFTGAVKQMPMPGGGSMPMQPGWTFAYAATVLAIWAIMMLAMMLPVGAPAVIRAVRRANSAQQGLRGLWTGLVFAAAYMSVWLGFGVAATLLEWGLDSADPWAVTRWLSLCIELRRPGVAEVNVNWSDGVMIGGMASGIVTEEGRA